MDSSWRSGSQTNCDCDNRPRFAESFESCNQMWLVVGTQSVGQRNNSCGFRCERQYIQGNQRPRGDKAAGRGVNRTVFFVQKMFQNMKSNSVIRTRSDELTKLYLIASGERRPNKKKKSSSTKNLSLYPSERANPPSLPVLSNILSVSPTQTLITMASINSE